MRLPETIELKHATRGVNIFLLSKLGCETFGSQLLYLWEITVNEVQFQVPHHSPTLAPAQTVSDTCRAREARREGRDPSARDARAAREG